MGTFLGTYRLEKQSKSHRVSENSITIGIPIQTDVTSWVILASFWVTWKSWYENRSCSKAIYFHPNPWKPSRDMITKYLVLDFQCLGRLEVCGRCSQWLEGFWNICNQERSFCFDLPEPNHICPPSTVNHWTGANATRLTTSTATKVHRETNRFGVLTTRR